MQKTNLTEQSLHVVTDIYKMCVTKCKISVFLYRFYEMLKRKTSRLDSYRSKYLIVTLQAVYDHSHKPCKHC
jgi:hypothetical protein